MRRRWLFNLALLAVVLALAGRVWLGERLQDASLARLATGEPMSLRVERGDEPTIVLVRSSEGWWLIEPRRLPASELHVEMILRFLATPVAARYPAEEIAPGAAGLLAPRLALVADGARFDFGAREPLTQHRYLAHDGEILLVPDGVSPVLGGPWWNFIDRRLLPAGAEPVALQRADGRRLGRDEIPRGLALWAQARAERVRPGVLPAAEGEEIVLELADGERQRWLWRAGEVPGLLRPELGLFYELDAAALHILLGRGEEG